MTNETLEVLIRSKIGYIYIMRLECLYYAINSRYIHNLIFIFTLEVVILIRKMSSEFPVKKTWTRDFSSALRNWTHQFANESNMLPKQLYNASFDHFPNDTCHIPHEKLFVTYSTYKNKKIDKILHLKKCFIWHPTWNLHFFHTSLHFFRRSLTALNIVKNPFSF